MQFRLSRLFSFVAVCAVSLAFIAPLVRHWDLRSYYLGFYGPPAPLWASGTGNDQISESLGAMMSVVWACGPWVLICGIAAFGAAAAVHAKGGAQ